MRNVRLVASDLDGTLLGHDRVVSARSRAAIASATAAGLPVLIATGRPVRWLHVLAGLDLLWPMAIASNGAALVDLRTFETVAQQDVPAQSSVELAERVREVLPEAMFGVEYGARIGVEPGFVPSTTVDDGLTRRGPLSELVEEPFVKLLLRETNLPTEELAAVVAPLVGPELTMTFSGVDNMLEIAAAGVSKAGALAAICEARGIGPAEVTAFGDMPNDLEMLLWAGEGKVMANGHETLLAHEDLTVVGHHGDDAVAEYLEGWVSAHTRRRA